MGGLHVVFRRAYRLLTIKTPRQQYEGSRDTPAGTYTIQTSTDDAHHGHATWLMGHASASEIN